MAQYWTTTIHNPTTGQSMRAIVYANDASQAHQRIRSWIATNPFGLGSTDMSDFVRQFDSSSANYTPSTTAPAAQGGDTRFDWPSGSSGTGDGGGGAGPGPDTEVQQDFTRSAYNQGLRGAGRDPYGAAGKYLRNQFDPTFQAFKFSNLLSPGGGDDNFQGYAQNTAGRGRRAIDQDAFKLFQGLAGQGSQFNSAQPSFTEDIRKGLYGATEGDAQDQTRAEAMGLANSAARSRVSAWWGDQAFDEKRIAQDWDDEFYKNTAQATAGGGQGGLNLIDFLRRRYRL